MCTLGVDYQSARSLTQSEGQKSKLNKPTEAQLARFEVIEQEKEILEEEYQ